MTRYPLIPLATLALLAACVPSPQQQRSPAVQPRPAAPRPAAPALPPPPVPDWSTAPRTPGTWVFRRDERGSIALFGPAGASALITLRCDLAARHLYLSRATTMPGARTMTVRASAGLADLPARPTGSPGYIAADVAPTAAILDQVAFSRGQFAIESAGDPRIIAPSHPEFARVVEDCRG